MILNGSRRRMRFEHQRSATSIATVAAAAFGAALTLGAALFAVINFPDLVRYVRMRRM
jgi:hypothetical protein